MMNRLTIVACLASLASPVANAEFYLGGKIGQTWLDDSCKSGRQCDDESFGGGIYVGYDLFDNFAVEVGYDYLGDFESSFPKGDIDDDVKAFTLAPKFHIPVSSFDLFAKFGAAWMSHGDADDLAPMAAFGTEYNFTSKWAARLEYQYIYNFDDGDVDEMDSDSLFLGLTYRFGTNKPVPPVAKVEPAPAPVEVTEPPTVQMQTFTELFASNSVELHKSAEQYLAWVVEVMQKYPQANVRITGHTDSVGAEDYNQTLSENRAKAVAGYLYEQGIEPGRVTATGKGEMSPIASNDTEEGRKQNRRVEVMIDEFEIVE